jgi:hypothetical protein
LIAGQGGLERMKSNQCSAALPYLLILLGLFALSITAPRAWNRQRYDGPSMEHLLDGYSMQIDDSDHEGTLPRTTDGAAWIFSGKSVGPVLVKPLREFGRRVIDPIVEFARKPTNLRVLPDLYFPKFQTRDNSSAELTNVWALPEALLEALDRLAAHPEAADWANHLSQLVRELHQRGSDSRPTSAILGDLRGATDETALPTIRDPIVLVDVQRARYALVRRLEIWDRVARVDGMSSTDATTLAASPEQSGDQRMAKCLDDLEQLTATVNAGDAWRDYLLVSELRALSQSANPARRESRELAQQVLARLEADKLSPRQRQFAAKTPIVTLSNELRGWAAEPVDMSQLLTHLERYERTQLSGDARLLAADCRALRWRATTASQDLGERVDLHYRNANVRVALTPAFVNRFVPQPYAVSSRVSDTIQGVPVRGRSTTFTKVSVRAIPDPRRIRLGLEADGIVASTTMSDAGPATFHNQAESGFQVRKLVLFGPSGLRMWSAMADADSYYTNLTDVETSFDGVPLVGSLVRNIARSQHDDAQDDARREMEGKVAARARRQFDEEVQPRLDKLATKVDAEMLEPLRRLGLEPTALDMQTTEDRLTMRMRLASDEQLGAHTPRPRAPSDSLASLQVHQSAINNLLESLDLTGREFTVPELYQWIGRKLSREIKSPEDVPDDVVIRFADQDAVRVRCLEGRVDLAIAIAKLSHSKRRWRDFVVKTTYQPDPTSLEGRFVRSSGIFLEGKSVQGRAEFVLRSILSKALSVDRPWRIVPEKFATDPRMADLEVAQFVVEDGWIGFAYAPQRVPTKTARRAQ